MAELPETAMTDGLLVRSKRWIVLAVCVVVPLLIGTAILNQTRNEITVVNNSSVLITFELDSVSKTRTSDDQVPESIAVFDDPSVPPQSKIVRNFNCPANASLVIADVRLTDRGRVTRYQRLPRWGNRILITEGQTRSTICDISFVREWFDANKDWLPLSIRWLD